MDWTVMANPSPSQVPPQWNPRSPAPPLRGFFFCSMVEGRRAVLDASDCLLISMSAPHPGLAGASLVIA